MAVPAVLRREMAVTLRTMPPGLGVVGLSSASIRVNGNVYLLSDSSVPFSHVEEENLVALAIHDDAARTSFVNEARHRWLYAHSSAQAIVMVHPTAAVACAVRGTVPDPACFPAVAAMRDLRPVPADPATWISTVSTAATFLVRDGTVIACGSTLRDAIAGVALVARWCEVYLLTGDRAL